MKKNSFRDEYYNNLIRTNIIRYRKLLNLTQFDIVNKLDLSTNYYSKIESPNLEVNCPIYLADEISEILAIDIKHLLMENPPMPSSNNKFGIKKHKENYYYDIIRKHIKRYRLYRNLSQENLSIQVGHGHNYISRIENTNQKITFADLGRVDALNISIEKFLKIKNNVDN